MIFENSAVAILLKADIFNALVGPGLVASQIGLFQVKPPDPTVKLYRDTLTALVGAASAHGAVGLVVGVATVLYLIIAGGAEIVGGVIVFVCEAASLVGAPAAVTGELMGTLAAGIRAAQAVRAAVAAGAAMVVFATPRASMADAGTPVAIDVSFPKFVILPPDQTATARVGQSMNIDGAEWIIAGFSTTLPD